MPIFTSTQKKLSQKRFSATLRIIPNWKEYFQKHQPFLQSKVRVIAQGGTIDCVLDEFHKLIPAPHFVTIRETDRHAARSLAALFKVHSTSMKILGDLYSWTRSQVEIPWAGLQAQQISRISSFDSSQELPKHFLAVLLHVVELLEQSEVVIVTLGTDSLANKAAVFATILSPYLNAAHKKIVLVGSSEPGYKENSLAIANITAGLYVGLEAALPGGVYIVSAARKDGQIVTDVLPGLGAVKLRADGLFHAPNSGPILTISGRFVYKMPVFDRMLAGAKELGSLPDLSKLYLNDNALDRLEKTFPLTSIETVENDPAMIAHHYDLGKRVFIIRARGSGNAPKEWKDALRAIVKKPDATVVVITLADSGDVNLGIYAAGLDLNGVLSGRTLREEAAVTLSVICHDLRMHEGYAVKDLQQLIERFCYLSGMV